MQAAEPRKLRALRDRESSGISPRLRAMFQFGLKADDVVKRAELVVLAQLDYGIRLDGRDRADWSGRPASSGRGARSRGRARP